MENIYNYLNFKKDWKKVWLKNGYYKPIYKNINRYCIVIPPPNITGKLHMGHAFQCTLMDILIRYYKMKQHCVLWKFGTDHAGIATQILLETKFFCKDLDKLLLKASKWKKKSIKNIKKQMYDLGFLINLDTSRFTLDRHFSYAVRTAFIKLYDEGLIYQTTKLVNWDMKLQTAISDLETIYKSENSKIYFLKYKFEDSNDFLLVATTRPETIFADVAIAVNPYDLRYNKYINKRVLIPIINVSIPIIFDEYVDMNFGTGCLKVTPGHDFNDFDIGMKHKLSIINIFTQDGLLNENVPKDFFRLSIVDARKKVLDVLTSLNLIFKEELYKNKVPIGDRSGSIIEPFLTTQWYVAVKPLIVPIYDFLNKEKIKIIPLRWKNVFISWLDNIKDWCISRQIWWGHRIPVWYDKYNNIYSGYNELDIINKYNILSSTELTQEKDVLDTWFSSALWPFASLGWPHLKKEFQIFYPTSTLVTGFDIIFFWVIRMIMFAFKFTGNIPFKEVYIHGLIRDFSGNKMSKTKGNVIDPLDIVRGISFKDLLRKQLFGVFGTNLNLIEKIKKNISLNYPNGIEAYGPDVLRLTLTSIATENISLKLDMRRFDQYKGFCNKLWNAYRFINFIDHNSTNVVYKKIKCIFYDIFILFLWERYKKIIINNIEKRKFARVIDFFYLFFWREFCDWYIEITKFVSTIDKYKKFNNVNINFIFDELLLILHPIAPFITEELWFLRKHKSSIIEQVFPTAKKIMCKNFYVDVLKDSVNEFRKFKRECVFSKDNLLLFFVKNYHDFLILEKIISFFAKLVKLNYVNIVFQLEINVMNCFNINKSIYFITKQLALIINGDHINSKIIKVQSEIDMLEKTLKNEDFLKKANPNVIKFKQEKLFVLLQTISELKKKI